ncbi:MAG TPA: nucleotidyl transferase AbiEii/AbiGii toxin family protein [Alphaproteobacteria bacterium]|nr:nucleotidyl transferase AbiEii/AbiGii toxin family protein [Alphaproteobacteria bacterium]
MIKKTELLRVQKTTGLPLSTIEKDYVLSLLIWSITQNQNLKNDWVFKGGTCLKKCYFGDYRFSEDLDYTVIPDASVEVGYIKEQLLICFDNIFDQFAVRIERENLVISPFLDKAGLFIQIKIPYQGPLMPSGSLPKIKLDISKEEILILDPIKLPLIHGYSDELMCSTNVTCYSLYEIFAEKLRALVQRTRPRDLYDVVHLQDLFQRQGLDMDILHKVSKEKFSHKGLNYPENIHDILPHVFEETKADWDIMLSHQVKDLVKIDVYMERFNQMVQWIGYS